MNKKGWVGEGLLILAAIVTILYYGPDVYDKYIYNGTSDIPIPPEPEPPETKKSFDISQVFVDYIKPIRENMYSNSNNIVCYKFKNPGGKTDSLFTLHNEWFLDDTKIPSELTTEIPYDEIFDLVRYSWWEIGDYSKIKFKIGLSFNKKPLFNETEYDLIKNEELINYLKNDGNNIIIDDDLINDFIDENYICGRSDEEQTNLALSFIRENMNPPLETSKTIEYNKEQKDSKTSWDEKIGTSSEYSYVLVSLLRSIGIPSQIDTTKFEDYNYYYVKVYLKDKGWVTIDVFDENKELVE